MWIRRGARLPRETWRRSHRQGIALSEGAANLLVGSELLTHHFARPDSDAVKKLGITDFLALLESPEGGKFVEACQYLNTANMEVERAEAATVAAVKRFLRFFKTDPSKKEMIFKHLVRFSGPFVFVCF